MPAKFPSIESAPQIPAACRDLWDDLMPVVPHAKPPGNPDMLRLIAYDIADPKRLHRIAGICEDYGVRVQYSLFECWLEEEDFEQLWAKLQHTYDPDEDRLVAYALDSAAVRRRCKAGKTMTLTERVNWYVV